MDEYIIHINRREQTETIKSIESAIDAMYDAGDDFSDEHIIAVLEAIRMAINNGDQIVIPIEMPQEAFDAINTTTIQAGDNLEVSDDMRFKVRTLQLKNGELAFVVFTSQEEAMKGEGTSTITEGLEIFLEKALMNPEIEGIVFNPWGNSFFLTKANISAIFRVNLPSKPENAIMFQTMDITQAEVDCIVNAANESLLGGGGVDGAIHRAAGPQLLDECRMLNGCETGEAKITKGYNLKASRIIHTVGPRYSGEKRDADQLRNCYWNSLELARANDLHSIAFPAISTGVFGYPLEAATEIALKTVSDWLRINPNYGMAVLFVGFNDRTTETYKSIWTEKEEIWNQRLVVRENNGMLEKAIEFAMEAHMGASRKGTNRPYILHPLETLQILASMNADTNLMIAGVLHDTLEDTDATLLEIYDRFGVDVAALVNGHTEDKRKIWYVRKLATVSALPNENIRQKALAMADKVANMRNMLTDYKRIGEELWDRFNAPKHLQAWYYSKLNDGLYEMQNYPETADVYWEMTALYKDLFVEYFVDDNKGVLYQISADGESVVLKKGRPQWFPLESSVSKKARAITRKEAERIEDNWAEPFWAVHELDLSDATIEVYRDETQFLFVEIKDGELMFRGEFSETTETGVLTQEIAYSMDSDNTHRLLVQLRLKNGTRNKLSTVFKKEFGTEAGAESFATFCKDHSIEYTPLRVI